VVNTGKAVAGPGGTANSGLAGPIAGDRPVEVAGTGDADASRGGDANSGVRSS
jgi:hypothetical protein